MNGAADPALDRDREFAAATTAETNRIIAAVDAKAGFLLAAQGIVLAGLAVTRHGSGGPSRLAGGVLLVLVAATVALLLATLWPRSGPTPLPWFTYPGLRPAAHDTAGRTELRAAVEAAWARSRTVAHIVRRKIRFLRAALVSAALEIAVYLMWIAATVGGAPPF
ncbi:hypothetical protein [Pseudonocardia sp. HH130630-07]|uniref:hypothetical protein n=1 Tax=Pseudonocardia sp. HH130630-07 TaxID=1690815 RepID=UPI000814BAE7|nr:hypothetical protein [Pseudonocardia sp. HH130630-07]ANY08723.1 hypothetical protein AFB00_23395 [Pseudonocardia sp. HH130630-07]